MPASVRWRSGRSMTIPAGVGRPRVSASSTSFEATRPGMSRNTASAMLASFRRMYVLRTAMMRMSRVGRVVRSRSSGARPMTMHSVGSSAWASAVRSPSGTKRDSSPKTSPGPAIAKISSPPSWPMRPICTCPRRTTYRCEPGSPSRNTYEPRSYRRVRTAGRRDSRSSTLMPSKVGAWRRCCSGSIRANHARVAFDGQPGVEVDVHFAGVHYDFPALTGRDRPRLRSGLGLLESNHVAGRVAERAVPDAVRLIHGLLKHLATSGPDVLEGRIAILGVEVDAAQESLGEHLLHDPAVGRGCVRVGKRRLEDDVDVRLALGPDGGPAHALVLHVGAHLEPEKISVEGERLVVVVDGDEAVVEFQVVHATTLGALRRNRFFISDRFCHHHDDAGRDEFDRRVAARPVGAGRLADQIGEARAERAQRRTPNREARIGDRHVAAPEERFGPLDPSGHEVAVRALAERSLEAPREVACRHRGRQRKGGHVERPLELPIHAVLRLAQPYEVADVHGNSINGTQGDELTGRRDRADLEKPRRWQAP